MYEVRLRVEFDGKKAQEIVNRHIAGLQEELKGLIKLEEPLSSYTPSLQGYCKEAHLWAAKDCIGEWHIFKQKPAIVICKTVPNYWWTKKGYFENCKHLATLSKPEVDWDKSLIAPDGRLILVEGKKKKEPKKAVFKPGKYYKSKNCEEIIYCESIGIKYSDGGVCVKGKLDGKYNFSTKMTPSLWYELRKYNPDKKKNNFTRGEPIFVWRDDTPDTIPAEVKYFYDFYKAIPGLYNNKEAVTTFSPILPCREGEIWKCYRKYDPSLVGVPRKDWPKEE